MAAGNTPAKAAVAHREAAAAVAGQEVVDTVVVVEVGCGKPPDSLLAGASKLGWEVVVGRDNRTTKRTVAVGRRSRVERRERR